MHDLVVGLTDAKPAPAGSPAEGQLDPATDTNARCSWGASTLDYVHYHDTEWGRSVVDERTLFEKLCLEGFQSGLSWLTVLRKRESFRQAFADFEATKVATFGPADVERLLQDASIIRHRGKIESAINNAQALVQVWDGGETLADILWSHQPDEPHCPQTMSDIPAKTAESAAAAKELKKRGFRFVGPTTAYAAMQAMGVVNDHLEQCWVRNVCEQERRAVSASRTPH